MWKNINKKWKRFLCCKKQRISCIDFFPGRNSWVVIYRAFFYPNGVVVIRIEKIESSSWKTGRFLRVSSAYAKDILERARRIQETRDCGFHGLPTIY